MSATRLFEGGTWSVHFITETAELNFLGSAWLCGRRRQVHTSSRYVLCSRFCMMCACASCSVQPATEGAAEQLSLLDNRRQHRPLAVNQILENLRNLFRMCLFRILISPEDRHSIHQTDLRKIVLFTSRLFQWESRFPTRLARRSNCVAVLLVIRKSEKQEVLGFSDANLRRFRDLIVRECKKIWMLSDSS